MSANRLSRLAGVITKPPGKLCRAWDIRYVSPICGIVVPSGGDYMVQALYSGP